MKAWNERKKTCFTLGAAVLVLILVTVFGMILSDEALVTDFARKNTAPSAHFLFGTDCLIADLLYGVIDPRIRRGAARGL